MQLLAVLFSQKKAFNPRSRRFGWILIGMAFGLFILDVIPGLSSTIMYYVCIMLGIQNSLVVRYR